MRRLGPRFTSFAIDGGACTQSIPNSRSGGEVESYFRPLHRPVVLRPCPSSFFPGGEDVSALPAGVIGRGFLVLCPRRCVCSYSCLRCPLSLGWFCPYYFFFVISQRSEFSVFCWSRVLTPILRLILALTRFLYGAAGTDLFGSSPYRVVPILRPSPPPPRRPSAVLGISANGWDQVGGGERRGREIRARFPRMHFSF